MYGKKIDGREVYEGIVRDEIYKKQKRITSG